MIEISPAARLVLACARVRSEAGDRERIARAAAQDVDWDEALALVLRHGLAPLTHRHLASVDAVPRRVAAALWARTETVARRNEAMAAELCGVLDALDAGGVEAVAFKGPVLTVEVYGELGLREFGDLDLLVAPGNVTRAQALLGALGYRPAHALAAHLQEAWIRSPRAYEMALVDEGRGFMVELQWRANPGFAIPRVDNPDWWRTVARRRILGRDMNVLSPGENLLALLVHGSKHAWANLGWLVDIAEIARRGDTQWQRLIATAHAQRAARRVALGLELARRLLDAPLPSVATAFVDAAGVSAIATAAIGPILEPSHTAPAIRDALRIQLTLLETPAQRFHHLAMHVLTPSLGDLERWRLPRPLYFMYWLLRPLRLARKYLFKAHFPRTRPAATPRTPPPRPRSTG